jgi:hypothetical protein
MQWRLPNLAGVVFEPGETFERLRAAPSWVAPFVVLGIGNICAYWLQSGIGLKAIESASVTAPEAEKADQLMEFLGAARVLILGVSPLLMLVKWVAAAAVLYWLMVLVKNDVRFKPVLSVTAHCWVVTLLGEYMNLLILHLKGLHGGGEPADLNVVLGLDILLGDSDRMILATFLKNITVFSVWYVCLMTLGLSRVIGVSKRQAAFAVIFLWLLVTGWKVMFAALETQMPAFGG